MSTADLPCISSTSNSLCTKRSQCEANAVQSSSAHGQRPTERARVPLTTTILRSRSPNIDEHIEEDLKQHVRGAQQQTFLEAARQYIHKSASLTRESLLEHERYSIRPSAYEICVAYSHSSEDVVAIETPSQLDLASVPPLSSTSASARSRSSSPTRRLNPRQYRASALKRASIVIEAELPEEVDARVQRVLGVATTNEDRLGCIARRLQQRARDCVREQVDEAEWVKGLNAVIEDIDAADIKCHNGREFMQEVLPEVRQPQPIETLVKRIRDGAPVPANLGMRLPDTTAISSRIILRRPRPDICVGLSPRTHPLWHQARDKLDEFQANEILFSDPSGSQSGLYFPFLFVEAKSGISGGTLHEAQNQAAVAAAAALRAIHTLATLANPPDAEADPATTPFAGISPALLRLRPPLVFSITSEGPVHELWAHFLDLGSGEYRMTFLDCHRTTTPHGALALTTCLANILRWGEGSFKEDIVDIVLTGL